MNLKRWVYLLIGGGGLFLVYLFQSYLDIYSILIEFKAPEYINYTSDYSSVTNPSAYIVNKTFRYLLNDLFGIAIIYGLFGEKKYVKFAVYVLLFGLFILLPIYLSLFFLRPEGFTSMIGHLHRIILNPVLMMLLIPAFYYQKKISTTDSSE
jgi:exosortase F-associated protein